MWKKCLVGLLVASLLLAAIPSTLAQVTIRGEITAIDLENKTVTITTAEGRAVTLTVTWGTTIIRQTQIRAQIDLEDLSGGDKAIATYDSTTMVATTIQTLFPE